MAAIIEFQEVSRVFPQRDGRVARALDGFSLPIAAGQVTCLLGPSGCGKSTALRLINRLDAPTEGTVLVQGQDVQERDAIALRRGIGYVIQSVGLFPHLTIAENVSLLAKVQKWAPLRIESRVKELLELVQLDPALHAGRLPSELSGGQRQRAGVARALFLDPPIVLLDEPFGALDPITRSALHEEFEGLQRKLNKTMVLVTHDLNEAFRLGDAIAVMAKGRLLQVGPKDEVRQHPADPFVAEFLREASA